MAGEPPEKPDGTLLRAAPCAGGFCGELSGPRTTIADFFLSFCAATDPRRAFL